MPRVLSQDARMQLVTLTVLAGATEPVGSVRLAEALVDAGFGVAEATAGRLLRKLDRAGLTLPVTTRGRIITNKGHERLTELRIAKEHDEHSVRLAEATKARDVDEVLDLLHVRRVVEVEAVRLAALRATDEEIEQLRAVDRTQRDDFARGEPSRINAARHFHRLVARASHNRLLVAVAMILLDEANDPLARILDRLAMPFDAGAVERFTDHHHAVVKAISTRDPKAAERAMQVHFDHLEAAVHRHGARVARAAGGPAVPLAVAAQRDADGRGAHGS